MCSIGQQQVRVSQALLPCGIFQPMQSVSSICICICLRLLSANLSIVLQQSKAQCQLGVADVTLWHADAVKRQTAIILLFASCSWHLVLAG